MCVVFSYEQTTKWSVSPITCCSMPCVYACGLFEPMYMAIALCSLRNLLYRGYTCIISSSSTTSLCPAVEQKCITNVRLFLPTSTAETKSHLRLKVLSSCLQHRSVVISMFVIINSCSYLEYVPVCRQLKQGASLAVHSNSHFKLQ